MAELLGVVASSIAVAEVAAKAGSAIPKLKALWDEVQNVPETIQHLLKQIEILDPMVWEMENELNAHRTTIINPILFNDDVMRRSTRYCRESLQSLTEIVDDMSFQISNTKKYRRSLAKVKVVLKKKTLADLEARLRNALALLSFAQQSYMMSMMKIQPHVILGKLTTAQQCQSLEKISLVVESSMNRHLAGEQDSDTVTNIAQETDLKLIDRQRSERTVNKRSFGYETVIWRVSERKFPGYQATSYSLRLQLPTWLLRISWEIQVSRGLGGPSAGLRAWRVVQHDSSPAFAAIESGDVQALVQSLENRQSTLFDRLTDGSTLLHQAARMSDFGCAQFLQASGLSANDTDNSGRTPFDNFGWYFEVLRFHNETSDTWITRDEGQLSEWHRVLLPKDTFEQPSLKFWIGYVAMILGARSHKILDLLLQVHVAIKDGALSIIRKYLFFSCTWYHHHAHPAIFAFACENTTVLNHLLYDGVVGDFSLAIGSSSWPLSKRDADAWGQCLTALIGADKFDQAWLHSTKVSKDGDMEKPFGDDDHTPLSYLLQGYCCYHYEEQGKKRRSRLISVLHFWLHLLQQNQVDLIAYGLHERQHIQKRHPEVGIFRRRGPGEEFWFRFHSSGVPERLLDIKYGPDPGDWDLIWDIDIEQMAGDFWTSLNEPEFAMPGQWVDD